MCDIHSNRNIFSSTMADMSWTEIKKYANENAVVLLPIGVLEEHGPHLCSATDIYAAHIYCLSIKKKLEQNGFSVIIAPPFYWGICQAGKGFIGSFSIREETAYALLFDILTSLRDFGFNRIFGINGHGDIDHKKTVVKAFKDACEQLEVIACTSFNDFMTEFLGYQKNDPWFYNVKASEITVSKAEAPDVHAGDIETALIDAFYPDLVDTDKAKALSDVPLGDNFEAWMFGGQLKNLSPEGYLGSPASYEKVNVTKYMDDYSDRYTEAILTRLNMSK